MPERVPRSLGGPADVSEPRLWVWTERRSRLTAASAPLRRWERAALHSPTRAVQVLKLALERLAR